MLPSKSLRWIICFLFLLCVVPAHAHVGSPDVYAEGDAGPYKLFVVIRPPLVIPGVAEGCAFARSQYEEGAGPR